MATKKKGSTSQNRSSAKHRVITGEAPAGVVSLSDADREYLSSGVNSARSRFGDEADESAVFEMLEKFGLSSDRVERLRSAMGKLNPSDAVEKASEYFAEQIENAKDYSRENPGKVLGGAAGVLVGASLLAMALNRAGGESTGSSRSGARSSKKSGAGSRKSSSKKSGSGASRKSTSRKSAGGSSKRSSGGSSSGGASASTRKGGSTSSSGSSRKSASSRKSGSTRKASSSGSGSSKRSTGSSTARKGGSTKSSSSRTASGRGGTKKSASSGRRSSSRRSAS